MALQIPKFSFPVPADKSGNAFSSAEAILTKLLEERSGQYLVGRQGMWHGGIHFTEHTVPWCALSSDSEEEKACLNGSVPHKGEQFIRCMADGEIVAWRIGKDYEGNAITWRGEKLHQSSSFVLVKHYVQPGSTEASGLTFYTLYMHLAPFSVYGSAGNANERKVRVEQLYYLSKDDVLMSKKAGVLKKDAVIILSNNMITRASDKRQFTEVILTAETPQIGREAALPVGTLVWTVSDQESLVASQSVPPPPWWSKCTPAYSTQPKGVVQCTSRTNWPVYLSKEDVLARKISVYLSAGFPLSYEPDNEEQQIVRPAKEPIKRQSDQEHTFSLVTLGRNVGKLKKGDRVWVVSDGDSLTPVATGNSGGEPKFDEVVKAEPAIPVSAGDNLGHMGFYQLPLEDGKTSRYQVHIECLSTGDLDKFLSNPELVNEKPEDPKDFISYAAGVSLYEKESDGTWKDTGRKTQSSGLIARTDVQTEPSGSEAEYYSIESERGWLKKESIELISRWSLDKLGFLTLDRQPESFDLIDGTHQPDNVVKGILEQLYKAAQEETRTQYMLNHYNYKQLLDQIDSNGDGHYSQEEYLTAVHNPSYREYLYKIIAKHYSEWYYGKDDDLWKNFLDTLNQIPHWRDYTKDYIEKMKWMKEVPGLADEVWHMHPVVFLDAFHPKMDCACNRDITFDEIKDIAPSVTDEILISNLNALNEGFNRFGINTCRGKSHFLSQVLHESGHFRYTSEIGGDRASYQPWYGRGLIQITFQVNYDLYGAYIAEDVSSSSDARDKLTTPPHSVLSAFWFYNIHKSLNTIADNDDFNKITVAINGGLNGYNDRLDIFKKTVEVLKGEHLNKLMSDDVFPFEDSSISQSKIYSFAWGLWHDPGSNRRGTDKSKSEALKGYRKTRDLINESPFRQSQLRRKVYGFEYGNILNYVNDRIAFLERI